MSFINVVGLRAGRRAQLASGKGSPAKLPRSVAGLAPRASLSNQTDLGIFGSVEAAANGGAFRRADSLPLGSVRARTFFAAMAPPAALDTGAPAPDIDDDASSLASGSTRASTMIPFNHDAAAAALVRRLAAGSAAGDGASVASGSTRTSTVIAFDHSRAAATLLQQQRRASSRLSAPRVAAPPASPLRAVLPASPDASFLRPTRSSAARAAATAGLPSPVPSPPPQSPLAAAAAVRRASQSPAPASGGIAYRIVTAFGRSSVQRVRVSASPLVATTRANLGRWQQEEAEEERSGSAHYAAEPATDASVITGSLVDEGWSRPRSAPASDRRQSPRPAAASAAEQPAFPASGDGEQADGSASYSGSGAAWPLQTAAALLPHETTAEVDARIRPRALSFSPASSRSLHTRQQQQAADDSVPDISRVSSGGGANHFEMTQPLRRRGAADPVSRHWQLERARAEFALRMQRRSGTRNHVGGGGGATRPLPPGGPFATDASSTPLSVASSPGSWGRYDGMPRSRRGAPVLPPPMPTEAPLPPPSRRSAISQAAASSAASRVGASLAFRAAAAAGEAIRAQQQQRALESQAAADAWDSVVFEESGDAAADEDDDEAAAAPRTGSPPRWTATAAVGGAPPAPPHRSPLFMRDRQAAAAAASASGSGSTLAAPQGGPASHGADMAAGMLLLPPVDKRAPAMAGPSRPPGASPGPGALVVERQE